MDVFDEVRAERERQDAKWGEQNHPDGTSDNPMNREIAAISKQDCDEAFADDRGTWSHILDEEVAEAFAESDPQKLRTELLQVAAVAVAWVEAIDRRGDK
jgi:hypothetical protein